ncbi:MAG: hypothetical protein GC151_01560 [Betaproteobacteria bacterium]|nr:hypothetical protein [Betaproteobacteria bacterium]
MRFRALCVAFVLILQGCATATIGGSRDAAEKRYFSASSRCMDQSIRREKVQVPSGAGVTDVEVTVYYDSVHFGQCMQAAGYAPTKVDPEPYLVAARDCLARSRGAMHPEIAYAECVRRSGIRVEVEIPGAEK